MDKHEYDAYITMIARNGLDMGEGPRIVAETCVVDHELVGDEMTVRFSAEPFVDDPSTQTRLWPKDVLQGTDEDWSASRRFSLREIAVEVLMRDVYQAMMGIENDTKLGRRG